MGYFGADDGFLLAEEITAERAQTLSRQALRQAMVCCNLSKDRSGDPWLWGFELECVVLRQDSNSAYVLSLDCNTEHFAGYSRDLVYMPEFAKHVVEVIPRTPFTGALDGVCEQCSKYVRCMADVISAADRDGVVLLLNTCYPLFGSDFIRGKDAMACDTSDVDELKSSMLAYVTPRKRYHALMHNILARRNGVPWATVHRGSNQSGTCYLPGPLFGMGLCGLHVTMQCSDMEESRFLYDAMQPLCPVLLALSAATSVIAGVVLNTSTRLSCIAEAMDDRIPREREAGAPTRYGMSHTYISRHPTNLQELMDCNNGVEGSSASDLCDDPQLLKHLQSIVSRWPLAVSHSSLAQELDRNTTHCWEQLQSLTWQSCRWKPPPHRQEDAQKCSIGWRVEVRCMEMQLSVAENVAYSVFVQVLARAICHLGLLLYVPHSFIAKNMRQAESLDAISTGMFWMRDTPFDLGYEESVYWKVLRGRRRSLPLEQIRAVVSHFKAQTETALRRRRCRGSEHNYHSQAGSICMCQNTPSASFHIVQLSTGEILSGCEHYPGILPILRAYLTICIQGIDYGAQPCDIQYMLSVFTFIENRARGLVPTCAAAMRAFIAHIRNNGDNVNCDTLSEHEAQALIIYMLGARSLSLAELREYYNNYKP